MSITFKIVNLLDKFHVQNYFVEQGDRVLFSPIQIKFNDKTIEKAINKVFDIDGKPYQMDEFEKACLKELDF